MSLAFFAGPLPLPALRTDFDNFLVFATGEVRRFADILALLDFLELLM